MRGLLVDDSRAPLCRSVHAVCVQDGDDDDLGVVVVVGGADGTVRVAITDE